MQERRTLGCDRFEPDAGLMGSPEVRRPFRLPLTLEAKSQRAGDEVARAAMTATSPSSAPGKPRGPTGSGVPGQRQIIR